MSELKIHKEMTDKNLRQQNELLQQAIQINNQLTLIALDGKKIQEICAFLANHICHPICLVDSFLYERYASENFKAHDTFFDSNYVYDAYFHHGAMTQQDNIGIYPIKLKREILGFLIIELDSPLTLSTEQIVIEHGINIIALQLLKEKELIGAERQFVGEVLRDYVSTKEKKDFLKKLKSVEVCQNIPCYHISFVDMSESEIERVLNVVYIEAQRLTYKPLLTLTGIVFFTIIGRYEIEEFLKDVMFALKKHGSHFTVNIGRKVDTIFDIDISFKDAENMKHKAFIYEKDLVFFDDLMVENLFLDISNEKIFDYVKSILNPILQEGSRHEILFQTLDTYIECDKNSKLTCEKLSVHPNTLYYRLQVIEKELALDLSKSNDWFKIHLAMQLNKITEYL